jgi:hypothetical protein
MAEVDLSDSELAQTLRDEVMVKSFQAAMTSASQRPKGILVSAELFRALEGHSLIERKLATPGGLPALAAFGAVLPFYDGDVYIHCDPFRYGEHRHFEMPRTT